MMNSSNSALVLSGMQQTGGMQQMGMQNGMQPGMMTQYGMQNMGPGNGVLAMQNTQPGMGGGAMLPKVGNFSGSQNLENFKHISTRKAKSYEPGRAKAEERAALAALKPMTHEAKERGLARSAKPLPTRLAGPWSKEEVLFSLDAKVDNYARRHGGQKALLRERKHVRAADGQERQQELAMLDKMRKDEEAGALMLPVEQAADTALRSGFREYIDYAVDEVERFSSVAKITAVETDFDWTACGEWHDVPARRRSIVKNRIDGPASHLPGAGQGHEGMFAMDFLRDFCQRNPYDNPPPEDYTLQRMALYSREMQPSTLFRADNGLKMFEEEYDHTVHDNLPNLDRPTRTFKDREWQTDYSVV